MTKIKIMTDSGVQLTQEEIAKYNITIVPLSITIDNKTYVDGKDITRKDFIQKMDAAKDLPKTSQPSIGLFVDKMKELSADGSEVLGIFMTKSLSGTVDAAKQAAKLVEAKITIVDSEYIDWAEGFQVVAAAKDIDAGKSVEEILDHLKKIQQNMSLSMMVTNLTNIIKGGRLGTLTGRVASLLNIRIALKMQMGKLSIAERGRGKKFTKKFDIDIVEKIKQTPNIKKVGISYVDTPEAMQDLADKIKQVKPDIKVLIREVGPIVITHAGHGAYAIEYYTE